MLLRLTSGGRFYLFPVHDCAEMSSFPEIFIFARLTVDSSASVSSP
jgi:hypothetical protein